MHWRLVTLAALGLCLAGPSAAGSGKKIVIDVSQAKGKPGTQSARGRWEWDFNRLVALDLQETLEARGYRTGMVISEDVGGVDLSPKERQSGFVGADLVISIAHEPMPGRYNKNWSPTGKRITYVDQFSGYAVTVSKNATNPLALQCATSVAMALRLSGFQPSRYLESGGINGQGAKKLADGDGPVHFNEASSLLRTTQLPIFTLEPGVLQNPDDEMFLTKAQYRRAIASAVANGLDACFSD